MKTISLNDINLYDIGSTYQIAGTIWSSANDCFITLFPDREENFDDAKLLPMDLAEWEKFLRQTDLIETEVILNDPNGKLIKAILRKTQRAIDSFMQWSVFKRDNYTCRYCGKTGIPLTVDHIDLWEQGGATIPENLITACKKCNKDRGRMEYADWLQSDIYQKRSQGLTEEVMQQNQAVLQQLPHLQTLRVKNIRSR
jgi:HNH endonuclease